MRGIRRERRKDGKNKLLNLQERGKLSMGIKVEGKTEGKKRGEAEVVNEKVIGDVR